MKYALSAVLSFFLLVGAAQACPDQSQYGEEFTFTSEELYSEQSLSVTAGGDVDLSQCYDMPGVGWVIEEPDFSFSYVKTASYDLRFRTVANCDTVLLVNDATGDWHYDDDGYGDGDEVTLYNADEGYIDVWVGTYEEEVCDAVLLMESFD